MARSMPRRCRRPRRAARAARETAGGKRIGPTGLVPTLRGVRRFSEIELLHAGCGFFSSFAQRSRPAVGDDTQVGRRTRGPADAGRPTGTPDARARLDRASQVRRAARHPPVMPPTSQTATATEYAIAARQFRQQVLPRAPADDGWGYGARGSLPGAHHFNFRRSRWKRAATRRAVTWVNGLAMMTELLPTLPSTRPPLGQPRPRSHGHGSDAVPGPVPIVTHATARTSRITTATRGWYLPDAPTSGRVLREGALPSVEPAAAARALRVPNDQRHDLWYHDTRA